MAKLRVVECREFFRAVVEKAEAMRIAPVGRAHPETDHDADRLFGVIGLRSGMARRHYLRHRKHHSEYSFHWHSHL